MPSPASSPLGSPAPGRSGKKASWMDLESVIQSEVSQKEKNKYRMLTHIYMESKKKGTGEPSCRTGIKM